MLKNKVKAPKETNRAKDKSETNDTFIKQVNYLQKILGNKEVENLIEKGILNRDPFLKPPVKIEEGLIRNETKKEEYEEEQIKMDREALMGEIGEILLEKKEKADSLIESSYGASVYVNVTTHLVFAEIPGEKPSLFYHYTDLVDVDLSYQNINRKDQPQKIKRGEKIPFIFSFKYEQHEEEIKTIQDNELEGKAETEKTPVESKLSPKGKTERTTRIEKDNSKTTLFNEKKKGKKG